MGAGLFKGRRVAEEELHAPCPPRPPQLMGPARPPQATMLACRGPFPPRSGLPGRRLLAGPLCGGPLRSLLASSPPPPPAGAPPRSAAEALPLPLPPSGWRASPSLLAPRWEAPEGAAGRGKGRGGGPAETPRQTRARLDASREALGAGDRAEGAPPPPQQEGREGGAPPGGEGRGGEAPPARPSSAWSGRQAGRQAGPAADGPRRGWAGRLAEGGRRRRVRRAAAGGGGGMTPGRPEGSLQRRRRQ